MPFAQQTHARSNGVSLAQLLLAPKSLTSQPFAKLSQLLSMLRHGRQTLSRIEQRAESIQMALARLELRQLDLGSQRDIHAVNLKVFSQWGEDGILQWLLHHIQPKERRFVEFGVENYEESNTRFLLMNNNWQGLVMDGSAQHVSYIRNSTISWRFPLTAIATFVTRENINALLETQGFGGELGLLSIDVDGNDYWIWEALSVALPAIVVVEYNHRFGPKRAVTTPYRPDFRRLTAHPSGVYYGSSLSALETLGHRKGYDLVGCNNAGNNAFFVRKALRPEWMPAQSAEKAFIPGHFREARKNGDLLLWNAAREAELLEGLPLVEVS